MYVIEDEEWVLEDMEFLFAHYAADHLVYTFPSGSEAVMFAQHTPPDVVITDIRMPGIDGLETIKQLQTMVSGAVYIILSGYDEFHYAQQGLRLGVKDFLLKPVPTEILYGTINRVVADLQLERSKENRTLESELIREIRNVNPENTLLHNALAPGGRWCAAMMLLDNWEAQVPLAVRCAALQVPPVEGKPEDALLSEHGMILEIDGNCIIRLWRMATPNLPQLCQLARKWHLQAASQNTVHTVFLVAESDEPPLSSLYTRLAALLEMHVIPGCSSFTEGTTSSPEIDYAEFWDTGRLVEAHLHSGSSAELRKYSHELLAWLQERKATALEAKELLANLLYSIRFNLRAQLPAAEPAAETDGLAQALRSIGSYAELASWLEVKFYAFLDHSEAAAPLPRSLVRLLSRTVETGYRGSISLQEFSQKHHISVGYMSRLFKSETGVNFSEYLTGYRLDQSLPLLRDDTLSLGEISVMVGYEDPKYFSQMFKKRFGSPPNHYRDRKNPPPKYEKS